MAKYKRKDSLVWGIILIVFGVLFILHNTIDIWWTIARLWPLILIVWGGYKLYFGIKERQEELKGPQPPQG
ncbi:MAG: DUF5668 domain-containing protein [Candidatus Aminicenantes bacterium]|jgi:hypothetical protein